MIFSDVKSDCGLKGSASSNRSNGSLLPLNESEYSDLCEVRVKAEDLTSEEIGLFRQNKEFHEKIKTNPNDPFIWIDYINVQDKGIQYSQDTLSMQSVLDALLLLLPLPHILYLLS